MKNYIHTIWLLMAVAVFAMSFGVLTTPAFGQEAAAVETAAPAEPAAAAEKPPYESLEKFAESPGYSVFATNNLWMMLAAALVFVMHLGFATLESGLTRSKNTVNVLFKNTLIPGIGILTYAICGYNLMYPGFSPGSNSWFGFSGWGVGVSNDVKSLTDAYNPGYTYWTDFFFQAMFAATAATIGFGGRR